MRNKISPKLFKNKKRVWIIGGIGFLVLLVLGFNLFAGGGKDDKASESPTASKVTKGQLASSTLLTGMVKAQSEQYVYFDNTIGRNAAVTVSVGEEVSVGQQLVQYDSTSAQAAYDTASRAYNKAVRDRNYFQQYGTAPAASAPAQVTYDILDGAGSSWTQNTDGSLAIRGSGEISKFREVKVDGVTVDPVNYTVTEGSTIITFKPEYLKSLSAGNHSFELVWTDGTAATNFTVAENADQSAKSPKTGEDFSMVLCTVLLMVSCAGLAGMFAKRKRNHAR